MTTVLNNNTHNNRLLLCVQATLDATEERLETTCKLWSPQKCQASKRRVNSSAHKVVMKY